jgi:hypothetical protein
VLLAAPVNSDVGFYPVPRKGRLRKLSETELSGKVKAVEQYYDYTPPVQVHRSLRLLLRYIPEEYLKGLSKITLTNSENLRSVRGKMTSEKRRLWPADCQGLYR